MLDFEPRFLGAVPTPGVLNVTRPFSTVSWSRDNQVALITDGGGVFVVDFIHTHDELESESNRFIGNESRIPCVKPKDEKELEHYTGISLSRLLRSKIKNEIFGIVRDLIVCPKELDNAEVHLCFRKVSWSEHPLKIKPTQNGNFEHILGVLDSHNCLRLYVKDPSGGQVEMDSKRIGEPEEWKICLDLTEKYRQMLMSQFWSLNIDYEDDFNEHKRRMYELATMDFLWLPPWEDAASGNSGQTTDVYYHTTLITAHASGDICIWNVCINYSTDNYDIGRQDRNKFEPNFYLTLEFRQNLIPDEIVSSLTFYKISSSMGLFIIGTTQGSVKAFQMSYNKQVDKILKPLPADEGSQQVQKYWMDNCTVLCDKDGIEVQTTCGVVVPKNEDSPERSLLLFVFKHPNFMMPFELAVSPEPSRRVEIEQVQPALRIVQGVLAGALLISQDTTETGILLMTLTQRGVLSWMDIQQGQVKMVSSTDLGCLEHAVSKEQNNGVDFGLGELGVTKKRLQFGGLAISPNKAMVCVSKTLTEYYNHLALRTPSVLQFHSVIPNVGAWPFLFKTCMANDFCFHRMTDVLTAFRKIMSSSDHLLAEILDWAVPLNSKNLQELQILLWILRIQPKVDRNQLAFAFNLRNEQPQPYHELRSKEILATRREALVSEHIIQRRCLKLVTGVLETPEDYNLDGNLTNLQSLMLMYDYLETKSIFLSTQKPLPLKPRLLVDPPPRKPACPLCGKATKLFNVSSEDRWKEDVDYVVEHAIDKEDLEGVLWHEQTHAQKSRTHPITNCILSLVPTTFPYRSCRFCGTICMLNPTFRQESLCPFCNGTMYLPLGFNEVDEDPCGDECTTNNELRNLVQEMQNQQEEELRLKAQAAPISRRARIENMYIDS